MFNVSILEAKTIIRAISRTYGTDLSGTAMASFRIRLSDILKTYTLKDPEALVALLLKDPEFYETFIQDVSIGSSDMFRDPELWIDIRDRILPDILKSELYPEILIPDCVTGGELYTMTVLLRETGLDYRVDLTATCRNAKIRDQVNLGEFPQPRFKNSMDNYQQFNPDSSLEQYTETRNGIRYLNRELIGEVEFRLQSQEQMVCSEKTALVLYRNKMIYQDTERQYRMLKQLLGEMKVGTYLIIGIQEALDGFGLEHMYSTISSDLNIYIKKDAN
ncbi:CheR family methyltransferase [Bacteroidota bacterium]